MKLFISVLFVIFAFSNSKAQGFVSMIDTSLTWENAFGYYKGGKQVSPWLYYKFSTEDTIFKNDTFRKLMAFTAVDTFVMGGLREDTTIKKSYGFFSGDTMAYLMYDWNIQDLETFSLVSKFNYKVQATYRNNILNKNRKVFELNNSNPNEDALSFTDSLNAKRNCETSLHLWYEGIGGSAGVLNSVVLFEQKYLVSKIYTTLPSFNESKWKVGIKRVLKNNVELLFPPLTCNDVSNNINEFKKDFLFISKGDLNGENMIFISSQKEISCITITTIDGKEFASYTNIKSKDLKINLGTSIVSNQFIIIKCLFTDGTLTTRKTIL